MTENNNATIAELRAAGKCFKCREPWIPGQAKVCKGKQIYSVIVVENGEGQEVVAVVEDGQASEAEFQDAETIPVVNVSMHAFVGTIPHIHTFTLKLTIGTVTATALVDSGSDSSFINAKFAIKSHCKISRVSPVQVAAANGTNMISQSACLACSYTIQGQEFSSDFRLLEVQGYDIILGADWLFTHSPVGLNLKTREFTITKYGVSAVTFADETISAQQMDISPKKLCKLQRKKQ